VVTPGPLLGRHDESPYPNNPYLPDDEPHYNALDLTADNAVYVDFSSPSRKIPWLKKFSQFSPTWTWQNLYGPAGSFNNTSLSSLPSVMALQPESMRIDLFMGYGGIGYRLTNGGKDSEFVMPDLIARRLVEHRINPYYVYFASTQYTGNGGDWKKPPSDMGKWQELCRNIAGYFLKNGIRLSGHEIWNEPDFGTVFYTGTWNAYIQMYLHGVAGIREANPDALVGGASAAYIGQMVSNGNMKKLLDAIREDSAPLDFISWHYYGKNGSLSNFDASYLFPIRQALSADPAWDTVQQHLNEFNVIQPGDPTYSDSLMVKHVYRAIERLVRATDVTQVFWACTFNERSESEQASGFSLISYDTRERFPAYRALWTYARLPVDRVDATEKMADIETLAGCDGQRAGLVIYNVGNAERQVKVLLDRIPFRKADVTVYAISDALKPSDPATDPPRILRKETGVSTQGLKLDLDIQVNGSVYIEISNGTGRAEFETEQAGPGTIVRKDYWYPDRGDNHPCADMHERSRSAWVGMGSESRGAAACGVLLDGCKDADPLHIDFTTTGVASPSAAKALGIRIEYGVGDEFRNSVLYALAGQEGNPVLPWGTKAPASIVYRIAEREGCLVLDLQKHAPTGWTGRIRLTYLIQDGAAGSQAKFILREGP